MSVQFDGRYGGQLAMWANQSSRRRVRRSGVAVEERHGLRLAFYGRTSTEDYQDPTSSRCWQRDVAENVIEGCGVIVVEFFDGGYSRRLPWAARPAAAALLEAARQPDREFDAIVVGEFERAFYGNQLQQLLPVFNRYGVQVWLPEIDGPLDLSNSTHQALMLLLGAQSRREVLRSRHRVLAAMCAQVFEQGRYLGGRPPYGYRLVDAGPHPNRAHAQWGRRLRRLAPDHTWQASLASRASGTGCPECRETGKSRIELEHHAVAQATFSHAASGQPVTSDSFRRRARWLVDITAKLPDGRKIAIEYDGSYWHADKIEIDTAKSLDLIAAGYLVARLREHPLPPLPVPSDQYAEFVVYANAPDPETTIAHVTEWAATRP